MAAPIAFLDVETTGLHPTEHDIWEVGLILDPPTPVLFAQQLGFMFEPAGEYLWQLPVSLAKADLIGLNIGQFNTRYKPADTTDPGHFAYQFSQLTWGRHIIGAVPSFDTERLGTLLRANGQAAGWHYQPIDFETLIVGWLRAQGSRLQDGDLLELPWNSNDLSRAVGVDPTQFDRHTALGDCQWAKACWHAVMGQ